MLAAAQWVSTTTGRITTDPYSWMQAVHWVGGSGLYTPSSTHSPKWGATTVLIAQELSALTECRPGIDYLARKMKCSVRTVKYHLGMLREAGLLVYRSKGTRIAGGVRQASVYERVIPLEFDEALGIRTVGEGLERRPVGIAEEGRKLIGQLAKKAARKVRRRRTRTPVSGRGRCTPMQGGTSTSSPTGSTSFPSETELASGEAQSPTPKKQQRSKTKQGLNTVGRRYQLARELIAEVPWLQNASLPRIAWVARHVADAGWTVAEVRAVLDLSTEPTPMRPSGMLAYRLKGVHLLYDTATKRHNLVGAWEDSRRLEHTRHEGWEWQQDGPETAEARRLIAEVFAPAPGTCDEIAASTAIELEDLPRDMVVEMRVAAMKNNSLITAALETGMSERDCRRLYTNQLVDQALKTYTAHTRIHA